MKASGAMKASLGSLAFLAGVLTLGVHASIIAAYDAPVSFRKYTLAAEQHLSGELPVERLMDLSPLYFELAVAATRLAGALPPPAEGAPPRADALLAAFQVLLVAVAAGFLAWLLERRFGRLLAGAGVLVFLVDRHVLVYERVAEPEACLLFFVLGWIFFLERAAEAGGGSWRAPLAAGVLAAATLLTRPTFLPLVLTVPLYLRLRGGDRWIRRSLVFAAPVAAALLVVLLRAAAVTGDPRTPVMNPGTVFYEGNQPLSLGTSAIYPPTVLGLLKIDDERPDAAHENYRTVARAAAGRDLSISEVNAFWSGLAFGHVRAEPGRFLTVLSVKLRHVVNGYRWHDVGPAWGYDRALRLPYVPFALLAAAGLAGMLFEARRGWRAYLYYGLAGLQVAVMLAFYVSARQRLVLLPAMIYFALAGIEKLVHERRPLYRTAHLAAVVLVAVAFSLPDDAIRDDRYKREGRAIARSRFHELHERTRERPMAALVDLALGAYRHAPGVSSVPAYFPQEEKSLDEALAELLAKEPRPGVPAAFDRASVFLRAGRVGEAEAIFSTLAAADRRVYRGGWEASLPRFHLARIAALRGDRDGAVRLLEEALERVPGDPFVLADLVVLTGETRYREALAVGVSVLDADYLLGRAFAHYGRSEEAAAALGSVVERLPAFRTARIHLAAALGEARRLDEGVALYLETVESEPDPLLLSSRIRMLFWRWADLRPEDPRVQLLAGHALHEHGYFSEAAALLDRIGTPPPDIEAQVDEERRRVRESLAAVGKEP